MISVEEACDIAYKYVSVANRRKVVTGVSDFGDYYLVFTRFAKDDDFGDTIIVNKETGKPGGFPTVVMLNHLDEIRDLMLPEKYQKLINELKKSGEMDDEEKSFEEFWGIDK